LPGDFPVLAIICDENKAADEHREAIRAYLTQDPETFPPLPPMIGKERALALGRGRLGE
jgi:hypothetical protein